LSAPTEAPQTIQSEADDRWDGKGKGGEQGERKTREKKKRGEKTIL